MKEKMKKILCLLVAVLSYIGGLKAQTEEAKAIKVGAKMPDYVFNDVRYYSNKTLDLKMLRGQYVILDFWATSCSGCIKSFPKVNAIQQKFKDKVKIISIGWLDKERKVETVFERLRKANQLDLTIAYDSTNFEKIVPGGLPFLVWIDKEGIIKAVTLKVTEEYIESFIADKPFEYYNTSYIVQNTNNNKFDPKKPFMIGGNGGVSDTSYLSRSIISYWNKDMGYYLPAGIKEVRTSQYFQVIKVKLTNLYEYGLFGHLGIPKEYYQKILLETSDTSKFVFDEAKGKGYYCYSQYMPKGTPGSIVRRGILSDLENVFRYKAFIEKRSLPCYVLKVINSKKVSSLSKSLSPSKTNWERGIGGEIVDMTPIKVAILVTSDLAKFASSYVFDETGIDGKINLKISALTSDYESIRRELNRYGLDLIKDRRSIDAIVLKDM